MKPAHMAVAGIFESPTQLRRAPKVEPVAQAFGQQDPYSQCMACWVDYMRVDDRDLGSRGMKLKSEVYDQPDVHERQRAADLKIGEAVNAMVDSLQIRDRWAIYRSQGISNQWRFSDVDYAAILSEARDELEKKLRKNIATRIYFL